MDPDTQNALIIKILGVALVVDLIGIVILTAMRLDTDPVQVIASACVGALAAKLTDRAIGTTTDVATHDDQDEMELLGRAVNKQLVAQFLRESVADEDEPKK